MIKITLTCNSSTAEEEIKQLFDYKDNELFFADIPTKENSVNFSSPPFKASFSLCKASDLIRLQDICSDSKDVDIVIEAGNKTFKSISSYNEDWISIIKNVIDENLKNHI